MNRYFFADVFAHRPLTGNPVVVVPDADDLGEVRMRAMAREFNQCETTFVLRPGRPGADWRLRSFTPIGAGGVRRRPQRAGRLALAGRRREAAGRPDRLHPADRRRPAQRRRDSGVAWARAADASRNGSSYCRGKPA
jgi:hypothetical protein